MEPFDAVKDHLISRKIEVGNALVGIKQSKQILMASYKTVMLTSQFIKLFAKGTGHDVRDIMIEINIEKKYLIRVCLLFFLLHRIQVKLFPKNGFLYSEKNQKVKQENITEENVS